MTNKKAYAIGFKRALWLCAERKDGTYFIGFCKLEYAINVLMLKAIKAYFKSDMQTKGKGIKE